MPGRAGARAGYPPSHAAGGELQLRSGKSNRGRAVPRQLSAGHTGDAEVCTLYSSKGEDKR